MQGAFFQVQKKTGALRRLKNRQWYSVNTGIKFSTVKADTATIGNTLREIDTRNNPQNHELTALSFAQNRPLIPIDIAVMRLRLGAQSSATFFEFKGLILNENHLIPKSKQNVTDY